MDNRRKKAVFRSWHRGTKEMDLILGNYAKKNIETLSDDELSAYEALLDLQDLDIYNWVTGKTPAPANEPYSGILQKIMDNKVYEK